MAILRGGRRIGPFDIRLGIPRDRSLDNVEGDRRLKRTMGGNPESTMGRVISTIAQGEVVHKAYCLRKRYKIVQ